MSVKKPDCKYGSVMMVDDNEIDNFINQKIMEGCYFAEKVFLHSSGKSAIEFIKNMERSGNQGMHMVPDLIFLDINMPIMDGFQFLEEFNKLSAPVKKKCRIIILTTSMNPDDKATILRNEFVINFSNKPLTNRILDSL